MTNNIRKLRKKIDITVKELASSIGVSEVYFYNLENSKSIPRKYIKPLVNTLKCNEEDLFGQDRNVQPHKAITQNTTDEIISIRLYDVKASAGTGIINYDESCFSLKLILPLFNATTGLNLKESDIKQNRFSFIKVEGDSMAPHIDNDDLILVDHTKNTIEHHRQILVFRDSESNLYIKEIHMPHTGKISVISYNKLYKSWNEEDKDKVLEAFGGKIDIIGKVIWHGKKVDYFR